MKMHTQQAPWSHQVWIDVGVVTSDHRPPLLGTAKSRTKRSPNTPKQDATSNLFFPLRVVGVLAFGQIIFFLVLFLFICAWAGAATKGASRPNLELATSAYLPQTERDPFGAGITQLANSSDARASGTTAEGLLKLKGILYDPVHPSAMVNGALLELNKKITIRTEQGDIEVKAVEITREVVSLDVGGRKVELRLGGEPGKNTK